MPGVEILTSAQVAAEWVFNWTAFWIVIGVASAIGVCVAIVEFVAYGFDGEILCLICLLCGGTGCLCGALFGAVLFPTPTAYETQYKVTISEEVSMTEFYEHYEVIEQDGKIFTVREKTK